MNDNHEKILKALTCVPLASTQQLAVLNSSLNPRKKASRLCRELEQSGLLMGMWHGKERIWRLSKRGRRQMGATPTRLRNYEHTLAVGQIYFELLPNRFLFEPAHRFTYLGKNYVWEPDAIYVHEKKVYCCEVQLTPLSAKRWAAKWACYNVFFNHGYFEKARFQEWSSKVIMPRFVVVTNQGEEIVKTGFNVTGRDLVVFSWEQYAIGFTKHDKAPN